MTFAAGHHGAGTRLVALGRWAVCWVALAAAQAVAAEVRLRAECRVASAVVRLGDVAEISSTDAAESAALAGLELFAAPATGRARHLTSRDVHEALARAGFDLRSVRLCGAARTCVSACQREPVPPHPTPLSQAALRRGRRLIDQALRAALAAQYGLSGYVLEWNGPPSAEEAAARPGASVDILHITPLEEAAASATSASIAPPLKPAEGASEPEPWRQVHSASDNSKSNQPPQPAGGRATHRLEFETQLRVATAGEETIHRLLVRASRGPAAVVARRTLAPGTVITPADVEPADLHMTRIPGTAADTGEPHDAHAFPTAEDTAASHALLASGRRTKAGAALLSWDECVGMETTRTIAAGQVLTADALRPPLLVKRGDAVTVYARSHGIVVRVTGRALESGCRGSMIAVESLDSRQRFLARVTGVQQVAVEADPQPAAFEPSGPNTKTDDAVELNERASATASPAAPSVTTVLPAGPRLPRSYKVRLTTALENDR